MSQYTCLLPVSAPIMPLLSPFHPPPPHSALPKPSQLLSWSGGHGAVHQLGCGVSALQNGCRRIAVHSISSHFTTAELCSAVLKPYSNRIGLLIYYTARSVLQSIHTQSIFIASMPFGFPQTYSSFPTRKGEEPVQKEGIGTWYMVMMLGSTLSLCPSIELPPHSLCILIPHPQQPHTYTPHNQLANGDGYLPLENGSSGIRGRNWRKMAGEYQ